jgi:hypothetical protein
MSYGADFANADPANAPLDAPILLGADPVLWGALALLLLASLMLGWYLGARSRSDEGDATASIWKAIDKAAKDAMKADDNALRGRAQALLDVIDRRLGKTLALAGGKDGLAAAVAALRNAIAGRRAEAHGGHGHDDHGHGHDHDDHKADHHGDKHDDHGETPSTAASAANIVINVSQTAPRPDKPGHDHPHPPRDMTVREQTDALRLAVAAFNEHWRHEGPRVRDMRAALAELSGRDGAGGPNLSHG